MYQMWRTHGERLLYGSTKQYRRVEDFRETLCVMWRGGRFRASAQSAAWARANDGPACKENGAKQLCDERSLEVRPANQECPGVPKQGGGSNAESNRASGRIGGGIDGRGHIHRNSGGHAG